MIRLILAVIAGLLVLPDFARAEDRFVTKPTDSDDGLCNADCSLREAIGAAVPGERVILPALTYSLDLGSLTLVGDEIVGANARTTIVDGGNNNVRVFDATGGQNRISGVTITGGEDDIGGGVRVQGANVSLTLMNVTVRENFGNSGGGVANFGATLDIIRSTITENRAGAATSGGTGGGVYSVGNATTGITRISNSTISANDAANGESVADGGGISAAGGTLTVRNATIAGNHAFNATQPGQEGFGSAISNSDVSPASITISNTIISGNGPFACAGGGMNVADRNVVDDSSCGAPVRNALIGALVNNGGQTDTHALAATSPAVDGGAGCEPTDQRGLARQRACDIGAFEYQGTVQGGQQPPPPPGDDLPPPQAGKNVNALPKSGTVKIKLPGSKTFVVLTEGQQIPVGTIVDARKGRVTLISAGGGDADFYGGIFKIGQTKGAKPLTTLTLVEKLACANKSQATAAAKKKRKRRLWGDGKGRFRTKGKHSAATVVGTKWLVEDRCTSTLTRVVRGKVRVRDFVKKKTVTVKAGKKYVARRR